MASTTAEVMLYFGVDGKKFKEAVNRLRFIREPELSFREIVDILGEVYREGYNEGQRDASEWVG